LQRPGYIHGTVKASAWIVAIAAELLLAIGGYTGRTIGFVHGHRVSDASHRPTERQGRADTHAHNRRRAAL
jgi:hypothetical protein